MAKETASIRGQLGSDPKVFPVLNANYTEIVGIEEQSSIITTRTIGTSFIFGHPTQSLLDGSVNWGESGRTTTTEAIVNPDRVYHEHFRTEEFKGTPFTANWDITNFRIAMSSNDDHDQSYNTVATFSSIALNDGTIATAQVTSRETKWASGDVIRYFLRTSTSNDWEEVTNNIEHTFTNTGTDLQMRVVFSGQGGASTYIEDIDVAYSEV